MMLLASTDIQDAQDEGHEQEAVAADQEAPGQLSHGRDRIRQPVGRREKEVAGITVAVQP